MMNDETTRFALACTDSSTPAPVLVNVQARGRLDAVLFELTLRQTYRNAGDRNLEVVYTFPLPPTAVLLGFASELNGARMEGVIVAKHEAERRYEQALSEGDAPVMLEAQRDGLHTANIGNLKPGDEIVLETRFAQLIAFEQGRLRLSIPTTIAPRYGQPEHAGLQPQQVPQVALDAEYPLALTLTIGQALAGATVDCPTHRLLTVQGTDGTIDLSLTAHARLDRDVVVIVTPRESRRSLLVRADDEFDRSAPVVMMAALQPAAHDAATHVSVKLLVDCSGSMNGDSIDSARRAVRGVVTGLTRQDQLSLSRFGSTTEHLFAPSPATPQALRHLQPIIDGMQADLGGTEMRAALAAVFELPCSGEDSRGNGHSADVLLITDGEIWQAGEMIAAARRSAHRVFAIGVGTSPAEGVLRALAESTGGACEFATPGEALEAAAQRMLQRMRQPKLGNVRIDWGGQPVWKSGPAQGVFAGDTVIAVAGFSQPVRAGDIRLLADDAHGNTVELARGETDAAGTGDSLARIAASRRMATADDRDGLALAVRYQLMSRQTHCVLVHRRMDADRATEAAELHRVRSMLAAGWGGLGAASESSSRASPMAAPAMIAAPLPMAPGSMAPGSMPRMSGGADKVGAAPRERGKASGSHRAATPARGAHDSDPTAASLAAMALAVKARLQVGAPLAGLRDAMALHPQAQRALDEVAQLGLSIDQAWTLLAQWVNSRSSGLADAELASLLQPLTRAIDPARAASATRTIDRLLGSYPIDAWVLSRMRRLRRALARIGA